MMTLEQELPVGSRLIRRRTGERGTIVRRACDGDNSIVVIDSTGQTMPATSGSSVLNDSIQELVWQISDEPPATAEEVERLYEFGRRVWLEEKARREAECMRNPRCRARVQAMAKLIRDPKLAHLERGSDAATAATNIRRQIKAKWTAATLKRADIDIQVDQQEQSITITWIPSQMKRDSTGRYNCTPIISSRALEAIANRYEKYGKDTPTAAAWRAAFGEAEVKLERRSVADK